MNELLLEKSSIDHSIVESKITLNVWSHFQIFRNFAQLNVVKTHAIGRSKCANYITRG